MLMLWYLGSFALIFRCKTVAKQNQVVKLLLSEGANLNLANAAELNPWQAAILGGNTLIAMLLAQSGADIDQRDKEGRTALHVAIENNFSHLACSLINCGCNLNIANKEGLRPIHLAISQNNDLVIRRLVESGCEIPESHKNKIKISIRENPNRQSAVLLKPVSLSFLTCTLITYIEPTRSSLLFPLLCFSISDESERRSLIDRVRGKDAAEYNYTRSSLSSSSSLTSATCLTLQES